ncbi:tetratricopeptide repeat protein [Epilithonimonas sp. JDS]|uniref:tetratricopeptide repeat protein n=1 Tax=Epilithonimonas sp. JDS TaxID=2902797 RepID=UPI001E39EA3C|nr:tetratricopeptide repeat protein [Epilithonimonas sp. JDS]MCD9853101.1 tetratricopeptide repeat protein [Epilithonimonas sp. JDS]
MKKIYLLPILFSFLSFSQNKTEAEVKVNEGVALHDSGKYDEALAKYDEALKLDKDNPLALTEKAMTLESVKRYDEAIEVSKQVLKLYPNEDNRTLYVTYANSLDHLNKAEQALKIYDEGIKKYPEYYQLYFNKGITLVNAKENEKAIICFQQSTKLNPNHSSSFNALAILGQSNRIASILAFSRYLVIDNKSGRAKGNFDALMKLMNKGVSQTEDKSISVSIDSATLDKVNKKKKGENDFSSTDMVLSMSSALDYDDKNKDKKEVQKFIVKFQTLCQSIAETQKNQKGYYREFLAPYFIEMEKKNFVEPFAYYIFPSQNPDVIEYNKEHSDKIEEFQNWSKNYWK